MKVKDKVILITGASSGIGKASALEFGRLGANLALAARRKDRLQEIAGAIRGAIVLPTDLSKEDEAKAMVDKTFEHFGRIDVLINNAAMIRMSRTDSLDTGLLKKAFETNVIGAVVATNRAVEYMKNGGGHIINIGSPGFLIGLPFLAPYAMTKAAFMAWTRTMQSEWANTNIFVTEYLPGYIKTDSIADSEFGAMGQDVFEDPDQNRILKMLAAPKSVEKVAMDLVKCVEDPASVMTSGFSVKLGMWLAELASFRRSTGSNMAKAFRKRLNLDVFKK